MKLIIREHINAIAEPVKKEYSVTIEPITGANRIPVNTGLMKGDILVYRGFGDVTRLPIGMNGQVLTVDSTSPLGVKWATPS